MKKDLNDRNITDSSGTAAHKKALSASKPGNIARGLILGGSVAVTAVEASAMVRRAQKLHKLSPLASAALGRTLIATAYMGSRFKSPLHSVTVNIKGDGPLGTIVTACDGSGRVRGYVQNPEADLPLNARGKLDVAGGVGKGRMSVVRDMGLKEPFVAQVELVSGEIAEDFTQYFAVSEQQPSAVALGVLITKTGRCSSAGGVFIHLLPGCGDREIDRAQQLAQKLTNISGNFLNATADEVLEQLFSGDGLEILGHSSAQFKCKCSPARIKSLLFTMTEEELLGIAEREGSVKVHCHFCNKEYAYGRADIEQLFAGRKAEK